MPKKYKKPNRKYTHEKKIKIYIPCYEYPSCIRGEHKPPVRLADIEKEVTIPELLDMIENCCDFSTFKHKM